MGSSGSKAPEGISVGPPGERGENGNSVRSGAGVPSNELGVNGDYYVNTAAHTIYGPKTGGSWGSATSLVGEKGATGLTGSEGSKGSTGSAGVTGSTGAVGPEGPRGLKGDTGATGTQGEKGSTGSAGSVGEKGEKGSTGSAGEKGSTGSAGAVGAEGPEGPRGVTGETGAKGSTGSTGSTGPEGAKGATGETGPKGSTGTAGAEGPGATLGEWKALSLETGITNLGAPYANAQCSKDSLGIVYLRGVVKSSGLLSKEAVIVTLPEGYRPTKQQLINANLGGTLGFLYILSNGKIEISLGVSLETNFSFDGIFFPLV
jgi:Collagen triple helix repeat (20 copies)